MNVGAARSTPSGVRRLRARALGRLVALVLLAHGCAAPAGAAPADGRRPSLAQILTHLAERGQVYRRTALRFSCTEEATRTIYGKNEKIRSQRTTSHDYLLEYTDDGGLVPYRVQVIENDRSTRRQPVEAGYHVPEPYAWNLLFTPESQGRFDYRLAGPDVQGASFAWVVEFVPTGAYEDGAQLDEWEGKAWVDQDTFDILRIEAMPVRQGHLVRAALEECRTAFRVFGRSTKGCPRWRRLSVEFGFERDGLRMPTRSFASTRLVDTYTAEPGGLEETVALVYDGYAFYGVETIEEFQRLHPDAP